jgi:putative FmdB family regulatory protein
MPIYEYECGDCGMRFDKLQRFGDPAPDTCPNGHKQVHRMLSQPTIIFKGSGFYVTDNGRSSRSTAAKNGQPKKKDDSTTSSKTESATESAAESSASTKIDQDAKS